MPSALKTIQLCPHSLNLTSLMLQRLVLIPKQIVGNADVLNLPEDIVSFQRAHPYGILIDWLPLLFSYCFNVLLVDQVNGEW